MRTSVSSVDTETDLDARTMPARMRTSGLTPARLLSYAGEGGPLSPLTPLQAPHSAPPVNPVAPMVYKPQVNMEDAIKWPAEVPDKLDFRKMEVFQGEAL